MYQDALLDAQRDLEARSRTEGYARFIKQQKTTEVNEGAYATVEATKVIRGCLPLVSQEITAWIDKADYGGRGKRHGALSILKQFDPDILAFITLSQVFSGITQHHTLPAVQAHIGTIIEIECIALEIERERGKKTANRIHDIAMRQGSRRNRTKAFKKLAASLLDSRKDNEWDQGFKVRIGEPLVNAVLVACSEIFELATITRKRNDMVVIVRLTAEGVELLYNLKEAVAWSHPVHRPMVVEPRPWCSFYTGCYYDEKSAHGINLIRTFNKDHRKLIRDAIDDGQMRHVLEAVNHIQNVPWATNKAVLEVLEWAWEQGINIPGLPHSTLVPLPERLPQEVYAGMSDFEKKGVRLNISSIREKNRGIVADKAVMIRDLETAKELHRYDRFWLPHNLDFRGRVYPVPHFSHQRADHIKALFEFADSEALGPSGGAWLAVHLANCGDFGKVSKRSFDERLQWVEDNEQFILRVAADPKGTWAEWAKADKPFQFLAACLDYGAWVVDGRGEAYRSHLPIALDGSNSGLQHYSAALRAEDEAALVSLVPSDTPADIYQTIADDVRKDIEREASEGSAMAKLALANGVSRSLVKRNVMTFAYSSAQYGFRQQLMDDTMRPESDKILLGLSTEHPWSMEREDGSQDGGWTMAGYLASHIYRSVIDTVTKATEGMAFFKSIAGILAHHNKPLVFTSPVGLPVMHKYSQWATKTVHMFLYDRAMPVEAAKTNDKVDEKGRVLRQVSATIRTKPLDKLDKDKARSAVAPNVIHAMDAAHLMLTVLDAKEAGINHIALIHDSFGTHAGRTQEFFYLIRQAFVNMYENYDPFEEVYAAAREALGPDVELPVPPEKGSLDLSHVLDADYAFA